MSCLDCRCAPSLRRITEQFKEACPGGVDKVLELVAPKTCHGTLKFPTNEICTGISRSPVRNFARSCRLVLHFAFMTYRDQLSASADKSRSKEQK
jgi:hypothetical protein